MHHKLRIKSNSNTHSTHYVLWAPLARNGQGRTHHNYFQSIRNYNYTHALQLWLLSYLLSNNIVDHMSVIFRKLYVTIMTYFVPLTQMAKTRKHTQTGIKKW